MRTRAPLTQTFLMRTSPGEVKNLMTESLERIHGGRVLSQQALEPGPEFLWGFRPRFPVHRVQLLVVVPHSAPARRGPTQPGPDHRN
jgi:hypothetical protein